MGQVSGGGAKVGAHSGVGRDSLVASSIRWVDDRVEWCIGSCLGAAMSQHVAWMVYVIPVHLIPMAWQKVYTDMRLRCKGRRDLEAFVSCDDHFGKWIKIWTNIVGFLRPDPIMQTMEEPQEFVGIQLAWCPTESGMMVTGNDHDCWRGGRSGPPSSCAQSRTGCGLTSVPAGAGVVPVTGALKCLREVSTLLARAVVKDTRLQKWVDDRSLLWGSSLCLCGTVKCCPGRGAWMEEGLPPRSEKACYVRKRRDCRRKSGRAAPMLSHLHRMIEILHWTLQGPGAHGGCQEWMCVLRIEALLWAVAPFVVWCLQVAEAGYPLQQAQALVVRASSKVQYHPRGTLLVDSLLQVSMKIKELGWWHSRRGTGEPEDK